MIKKMLKDKDFLRILLLIALPITMQNMISMATQMMDTIMLGSVGQTQLTASSLANQPFFVFTILTFGLASGASVLNSQYWGKREIEPIKVITTIVVRIAFIVSVLLFVLIMLFPEQVMRIYTPEEDVIAEGVAYLKIIAFSYLTFGLSGTMTATLRSVAIVKIAVVTSISTLFTNVFLNWVLIFGNLGAPAMGIRGAALATLIARVLELVIVTIYIFAVEKKLKLRPRDFLKFDKRLFVNYLKNGLPVVFNELLWSVGVSVQAMILGRLGASVVSASQIASVVQQFATVFIFGVANAAAVIIGNAVGEGNHAKASERVNWLKLISVALGVVSAIIIFSIRDFAVGFYNVPVETKELARGMLAVLAIIVFFVSITAVGIVGLLRGGGDTRFALLIDLSALWLVALPAGLLAAFVFKLPVLTVYAATKLDEPVKTLMLLWRMRNDKWIRNVTHL